MKISSIFDNSTDINNWSQSQLTQKDYCRLNNIILSRFGYWRTRLNRTGKIGKKLIPIAMTPPKLIQVFLRGGLHQRVPVHSLAEVLPIVYRQ